MLKTRRRLRLSEQTKIALLNLKKNGLRYCCRDGSGLIPIVSPKNARLKLIQFGTLNLARGQSISIPCTGREIAIVLLSGGILIEAEGEKWRLGPRKSVFDDLPWALYARGVARLSVFGRSKAEALVSAAPCNSRWPLVKLIQPADVVIRPVGIDTYARVVRTVIGEDFPAHRLLLGETINEAGKWSSYPPHRHEKDSPPHEARLEEVYYYRTEKPNGFGLQRIYTDDRRIDETHTVRSGDVCVLPRGYHPVSAAPSSKLYYFWVLAGKNRKMQVRVDPNFE